MSSAREVALRLLLAVEIDDVYANLRLPSLLREAGLPPRDRALATELGYGTLRAQGSLDHLLTASSNRPLASLDPDVRALLRLGAYQLWRTRIPRHAAVAATVDLAVGRGARGFVNAVLRRTAERCSGPDPLGLAEVGDPYERLALQHAHPRWVVHAYADALAGDLDEAGAALAGDDTRPTVHLAALPGRITAAELAAESGGSLGPLSPYAVHLDSGGDPASLPSIRAGRARVQDEGSQLVALALHRALAADGPGDLIDLTAGPGGKAALLAALPGGRRVLAVELHAHRAILVRSAGVPAVVVADGRRSPLFPGRAAGVLLDAPCTGLGALRRRPEARWRRTPKDLPNLVRSQQGLLDAALELVRPGGVVAYAVCSPHLAEAVLAPRPDVEVIDAPALLGLGESARAPEQGGRRMQLWPHRHGTDAMSLTLLRRREPAASPTRDPRANQKG